VFAAIGVAPVVVANPINLLVADQAGIGFNPYLLRMVPAAVLCWSVTWFMLRVILGRDLIEQRNRPAADRPLGLSRSQRRTAFILLGVVLAYPVASVFHDWAVAVVSVLGGLLLTLAIRAPLGRVLAREVEWGILLFMLGAFAIGIGLKNAGAVAALSRLYHGGGLLVLAAGSAVGSALLNNHPMTILNLLAPGDSLPRRPGGWRYRPAPASQRLPCGPTVAGRMQASRSSSATALVHHGGGSHSDSCVDRFSRRAAPAEWMTRHVVCPMILARPSFSTAVLP
jgi:Na+/H+ antiporter NhaD/arsenite permease-like protein